MGSVIAWVVACAVVCGLGVIARKTWKRSVLRAMDRYLYDPLNKNCQTCGMVIGWVHGCPRCRACPSCEAEPGAKHHPGCLISSGTYATDVCESCGVSLASYHEPSCATMRLINERIAREVAAFGCEVLEGEVRIARGGVFGLGIPLPRANTDGPHVVRLREFADSHVESGGCWSLGDDGPPANVEEFVDDGMSCLEGAPEWQLSEASLLMRQAYQEAKDAGESLTARLLRMELRDGSSSGDRIAEGVAEDV